MAAATSNHVPVMMRLLEAGADWTWSAEKQRGWDPDEHDEGQCTTALECAQGKGDNHYSRSEAPGGAEAVALLEAWAAEHPDPVRSYAFPPTTGCSLNVAEFAVVRSRRQSGSSLRPSAVTRSSCGA